MVHVEEKASYQYVVSNWKKSKRIPNNSNCCQYLLKPTQSKQKYVKTFSGMVVFSTYTRTLTKKLAHKSYLWLLRPVSMPCASFGIDLMPELTLGE